MIDNPNCSMYQGGQLPPCSEFLGSNTPIIKDGNRIYRNMNRAFYFISAEASGSSTTADPQAPQDSKCFSNNPSTTLNIQISLVNYLVGLFINQVQLGKIKYDRNKPIHNDKLMDEFIHQMLEKSPEIRVDFVPQLILLISNGNAILPLLTQSINITPLNFYILFVLNRLENNPGLTFGNNSFVTEDPINFSLAAINNKYPLY